MTVRARDSSRGRGNAGGGADALHPTVPATAVRAKLVQTARAFIGRLPRNAEPSSGRPTRDDPSIEMLRSAPGRSTFTTMTKGCSHTRFFACWCLVASGACATSSIPDPKDTLRAYQDAAQRGDSRAIYDMLSERSRKSWRPADVECIVADEKAELATQAKATGEAGTVIRASARV